MLERIFDDGAPWDDDKEWFVLDSNYREIIFSASVRGPNGFEECRRWLQSQCASGKCED